MDRIARLLSRSDRSSRILEIGPSYNPAAPKAGGWKTHVVDHASRDELRAKYAAAAAVDLDVIEDVDTLWRDGALHAAVPAELHGQFDTLIASHVIEHTPDLIGFLISASRLLRPSGIVALAIPDRRFCFDYFRSPTMTGDLLEAHSARRTRHTSRTAWNHMAYSVTMNAALAWGPHTVGAPEFLDPFSAAEATYRQFADDPAAPYADYHGWQFTPAGFALAILELGQLGVIDWQIDTTYGPDTFEFFVFLRRGVQAFTSPSQLQARRLALLGQQMIETSEQVGFALIGGNLTPETSVSPRQLAEIASLLREQDARIREIALVAHWVRLALTPARLAWRLISWPKRRLARSGAQHATTDR